MIVRESITLNEATVTKSYDTPMTREKIKLMIETLLVKYKKAYEFHRAPLLTSMSSWLDKNNFGSYQHNKWIKAIVDTLFKYSNGIWYRINKELSTDELTDMVMNYWQTKLKSK